MNVPRPAPVALGEFALALALRLGTRDCSALLVTRPEDCEEVARDLADDVRAFTRSDPLLIALTEAFVDNLRTAIAPVVIAFECEASNGALWPRLDLERSQFPLARSVVLVLSFAAFDHLEREAPNLASWLGAAVSTADVLADMLSQEARDIRLQALRAHFSMTDQEMLSRATSGDLPVDAEIAEWLVLIERGDLLERP